MVAVLGGVCSFLFGSFSDTTVQEILYNTLGIGAGHKWPQRPVGKVHTTFRFLSHLTTVNFCT